MSDLYPAIHRAVREIYRAELAVLESGLYLVDGWVPDEVHDPRVDRLIAFSDLLDWVLPAGIKAGFSGEVVVGYVDALWTSVEEMCEWWKVADVSSASREQSEDEDRDAYRRRPRYREVPAERDPDAEERLRLYWELRGRYDDVNAKMQPLRMMAAAACGLSALGEVQEPQADARHSLDFRSVNWFGTRYSFTGNQACFVKILWEAWENDTPEVGQATLLAAADAHTERLDHAFSLGRHPAWGTMIRPGSTRGTFQLCPPDDA
jgi:hypothetical protein